ncbi:oligosaccharide flippase family protein [Roseivivax sp. THAF197b]|uniref:oligosaccharide flippase family protein n=1 Tax=Roseivivax sp. THAF197b TaxID=2588299 RepID=UPI0012AA778A|nr:oligosaccharide flippase family protein [Roseivivax sp. THAF197b]QFS84993.1 Polysaccharide biosynthesis protein [Roseivivax sp. THAF197b]
MTGAGWAVLLQWSRLGLSALVFLAAARVLSLDDLGRFAVCLAPIRLLQNALRIGFSEAVILVAERRADIRALTGLCLILGGAVSACFLTVGLVVDLPLMALLSALPLLGAFGAVPEGQLRKRMDLRSLALRTVAAQALAAISAALALWLGAGVYALAVFALTATAATSALALVAMPLRCSWPARKQLANLWRRPAEIGARDMLSSGLFPLAQMLVAGFFGLAAAGAFQIAVRLVQLTEAMTLAPLRLAALPALRRAPQLLSETTQHTARIAMWAWPGLFIAAPDIALVAVGATHAEMVTPLLRALAPFGLFAALSMPWLQAMAASGRTGFLLCRSAGLLGASGAAIWISQDHTFLQACAGLSVVALIFWLGQSLIGNRAGWPIAHMPSLRMLLAPTVMLLGSTPLLVLDPSPLRLLALIGLGSLLYLAATKTAAMRPRLVVS